MRRLLFIFLFAATTLCNAQISRLGKNITYAFELHGETSNGDIAPFWFTSNKYGVSSTDPHSGYVRAIIKRSIEADSTRKWAIGYGLDMPIARNHTSNDIHQLYGEAQYKNLRLTVGAKELPMEFANSELSSGDMAMSINARPIPQLRLEMPDYWDIPGTRGWIGVKGHAAFGWFTDNSWQKSFTSVDPLPRYTNNSRYHSKAIYFRIGNEEHFPLTFAGGIRIDCQFGGEAWNLQQRIDASDNTDLSHVKLNSGLKSYWEALTFGGEDPNDGDFKNTSGNQLGSWHGSFNYKGDGWAVRGYFDHLFDDHSQIFWEYGWKDMTWGIEAQLPKNPIASTLLMELISTKDQTSSIYHDATSALPVQISGRDNYYNHQVYGGWQHWGMTMGNPLLLSPIYNANHKIAHYHNRIQATHLGIAGDPTADFHYRLLYTHLRSWGTYDEPLTDTKYNDFLLAELTVKPSRLKGWSLTAAFGLNSGNLLPKTTGGSITIRKEGIIR